MTPEHAKKLLPVLQAFAEGKPVQFKGIHTQEWTDILWPSFSTDLEWRIKPKPKVKVKGWINIYSDRSSLSGWIYKTKEEADGLRIHSCIACVEIEYEQGEGL